MDTNLTDGSLCRAGRLTERLLRIYICSTNLHVSIRLKLWLFDPPCPVPFFHRSIFPSFAPYFFFCFPAPKQAPAPAAAFSGFAYEGGRVLPSTQLSEKLTVHGGRRVAEGGPRWYSYRQSHVIRVPS